MSGRREANPSGTLILRRAALALALLAVPEALFAHAELVGTTPQARSAIKDSPSEVVIRFNERVTPIVFRVLGPGGKPVSAADVTERDPHEIVLPLSAPLADGTYLVTYRVASEDAHPISGSFSFSVGVVTSDFAEPNAAGSTDVDAWLWPVRVNRAIHTLTLLLSAGAALFMACLARERSTLEAGRALAKACAGIAGVTAVLAVGLAGGQLGASQTLLALSVWQTGFGSSVGVSSILAVAGLSLMTIGLGDRSRPWWLVAGAIVACLSRAMTGHPASREPRAVLGPAMSLHVSMAAFWLGSLAVILMALRRGAKDVALAALLGFSRWAVLAVSVLVLAGGLMSFLHLTSLGDLVSTRYGALLTSKVGAFVLLFVLAGLNKLRLLPRAALGDTRATRALLWSVRLEVVILLAVTVVSGVLASTPPPKGLPTTGAKSVATVSRAVSSGAYVANVSFFPTASAGTGTMSLTVVNEKGQAADLVGASVAMSFPQQGIEPIVFETTRRGSGEFSATLTGLLVPGEWSLRIEALVTDFDKEVFETTIPIK